VFDGMGWTCRNRVRLHDPEREVDFYAAKDQREVVIQLKSTLRPHSPWEVYKRNEDVLCGINHTADVLPRFSAGAIGFLVTDGYEGDFQTWKRSLETNIAVATLADLRLISTNPEGAFQVLKERAGVVGSPTSNSLPERTLQLCGWTIRLLDTPRLD
jgi:hypothetical protein